MLKNKLGDFARHLPIYGQLQEVKKVLRRIRADLDVVRNMQAARDYRAELEGSSRYSDSKRLLGGAFQVNSQNDEDGIIHEIFKRIGTTNRVFVEIGVGDGTENNTAFLLAQGWTGFWIDGNDEFLQTLETRADIDSKCLTSSVSFVDRDNVAGLFTQLSVPQDFDLLALDIDQNTYYVWEALGGFNPRAVVVEYNASIPPDVDWKVNYDPSRVWDGSHNFGASLKALELLGARLGYSLVGCDFNGVNAFFVRNDLVAEEFAAPFTAENHYEPPRYHYIHRRGHRRAILDR